MASLDKNIIVVYDNISKWYAVEIPSCKVENGIVKMREKMNVGDNCMDGKTIVTIKGVKSENKVKRDEEEGVVEEEYSYDVIVPSSDNNEKRYIYDEIKNDILEITKDGITSYNVKEKSINGKFILNKEIGSFIEGVEKVEGITYDCNMVKCTLLPNGNLKEGKRHVNNELAKSDSRLLKYVGNGEWKVENEEGYYFFDNNENPVGKDSPILNAIEVYKKDGKITQRNLMENNIVGYFLNKVNNNRYMVSNNGVYYSKGIEMKTCDVVKADDGYICKTSSESVTYEKGDYCNKSNIFYLLLDDATNTSEKANCITGTNAKPLYIESTDFGNSLNGVDVSNRLVELTNDAIRVANPGYYIVGEGNVLVDNNDDKEKDISIYKCTDKECEEISNLDENEKIIADDGTMFGMDKDKKLIKINKDGIYFFDSNGSVWRRM